jgi:hypothetical protein
MRTIVIILALSIPATVVRADSGFEFFEKKVRPVLVEHCYSCHSAQSNKKKGGLLLDTREAIRKGGDTAPAVIPGKPNESLLLKAVRQTDDMLKMPPKGKLPDVIIADLEAWVKMGAPDPRDRATVAAAGTWEEMLRNRRQWWSLQPVRKPALPTIRNPQFTAPNPIDAFILAKLDEKGLAPTEPADARTLIRRLSLVLTGLPPTPGEVESFVKESSAKPQAAIEAAVDRLLASPHFGERWARHWLDVVRFSETHGNEWNYEVHHAWRYRDYLIRAFNEDLPFDQFVREHIAGDLLPRPRWNARERFNESVIGTAFYRFGEANHDDCISLPSIGYDLADNQIDTLTKAFQATTVACARCHDHKLDAVSMKDYHALLGILRSSREVSHTIDAPAVNGRSMQRLRELKAAIRKELGEVWLREAATLGKRLLARQAEKKPAKEDILSPWRELAANPKTDEARFTSEWKKLAERYRKDERERFAFNEKHFTSFADFRTTHFEGWQNGGQGLRDGSRPPGDFILQAEGDVLLKSILPAGWYTHTLSEKLNGTLRSPVLPAGKKHISFQVMGQRSSALRLVSNNCQLNYKNYRALTSNEWQWITFSPPDERESLRTYAELMTMFDNPKFPDQLSALGGDQQNYRLPWVKASANPRSFFGITRAVLHDTPEPPKPSVSYLLHLFDGPALQTLTDAATRYALLTEVAIRGWLIDRATEDEARWIDGMLQRGLLSNNIRLTPRLEELVKQYRLAEAELSLPRVVPGMGDFGNGIEQPIFSRGDCSKPGETAPRRYLEVLSKPGERFASGESGRRELAERIASPDNPLTARVMVNRVWHHLFGTGLVRTVDDFGRVGEMPSHPELLDYLAARFVEDGWSVKRLIRSIVLTQTFQQANRPAALDKERDPQNRLLQHYPARRMEAEAIRDAILSASGRLDSTLYGMSIQPYRESDNADRRLFAGPLDGNGRRSVYIKNNLMESPRFLGVFDFPGGKVTQGRRDTTNVPAQALALLNDPFVLQQADVWARQLVARRDASVAERIRGMFQETLNRSPTREEAQRFEEAALRFAELHQSHPDALLTSHVVWKDIAHTMFNLKEFIYIP